MIGILPYAVKQVVSTVIWLLSTVIFISALASWIPQVRGSKLGQVLYMLTEPLIGPVRRLLRRIPALQRLPVDFSPMATYLLLILLERVVWML